MCADKLIVPSFEKTDLEHYQKDKHQHLMDKIKEDIVRDMDREILLMMGIDLIRKYHVCG